MTNDYTNKEDTKTTGSKVLGFFFFLVLSWFLLLSRIISVQSSLSYVWNFGLQYGKTDSLTWQVLANNGVQICSILLLSEVFYSESINTLKQDNALWSFIIVTLPGE